MHYTVITYAKLGMGNFKSLCHEDIALQKIVNEELWRR